MKTAYVPQALSPDFTAEPFGIPAPRGVAPSEVANLVAGLERQKEELGPIAYELIDLFRRLGVDQPPRQNPLNPSSE